MANVNKVQLINGTPVNTIKLKDGTVVFGEEQELQNEEFSIEVFITNKDSGTDIMNGAPLIAMISTSNLCSPAYISLRTNSSIYSRPDTFRVTYGKDNILVPQSGVVKDIELPLVSGTLPSVKGGNTFNVGQVIIASISYTSIPSDVTNCSDPSPLSVYFSTYVTYLTSKGTYDVIKTTEIRNIQVI